MASMRIISKATGELFSKRCGAVAITHLRRHQGLHILMCLVRGAKKHPEGLDAAHVAGLEVAEHNNGAALECSRRKEVRCLGCLAG